MRLRAMPLLVAFVTASGCNHELKSKPPQAIDETETGWFDDGKNTDERYQSREVKGVKYEWELEHRQ